MRKLRKFQFFKYFYDPVEHQSPVDNEEPEQEAEQLEDDVNDLTEADRAEAQAR